MLLLVLSIVAFLLVGCLLIFLKPYEFWVMLERSKLYWQGFRIKTMDVQGGKLCYLERGEGPPLVLIHGFMGHSGHWHTIANTLCKDYRVIIIDLLGHGKSISDIDELSLSRIFDALEIALDKLYTHKMPFQLMGHGIGGWLSLWYASKHPEKIRALYLINSNGLRWHVDTKYWVPKNRKDALDKILLLMGEAYKSLPGIALDTIIQMNKPPYEYLAQDMLEGYFLDYQLQNVTHPVYLFWGELDQLLPMEYAYKLHEALPHSFLYSFEQEGCAAYWSNPKEFLATFYKCKEEVEKM